MFRNRILGCLNLALGAPGLRQFQSVASASQPTLFPATWEHDTVAYQFSLLIKQT